mmetsp:Transcript_14463/g.41038  ORF Transcript_14463/g.41038 Transcript_14463/m.41038 type:complete len:252 (-) Transcript_14463:447-1202(-)
MDNERVRVVGGGVRHVRRWHPRLEVRVAGHQLGALGGVVLLETCRRRRLRHGVHTSDGVAGSAECHRIPHATHPWLLVLQLQQAPRDGRRAGFGGHPARHGPDRVQGRGPALRRHPAGVQLQASLAPVARALDVERLHSRLAVQRVCLHGLRGQPHDAMGPCPSHLGFLGPAVPLRLTPRALLGVIISPRGLVLSVGFASGRRKRTHGRVAGGDPDEALGGDANLDGRGRRHVQRASVAGQCQQGMVQVRP